MAEHLFTYKQLICQLSDHQSRSPKIVITNLSDPKGHLKTLLSTSLQSSDPDWSARGANYCSKLSTSSRSLGPISVATCISKQEVTPNNCYCYCSFCNLFSSYLAPRKCSAFTMYFLF